MGGDLNADYAFAKEEVERLHQKLVNQRAITKTLTSPDNIVDSKKKEHELERELGDWEGERDSLKHQVEKINQEAQLGQAASLFPGEGTVAAAVVEQDVHKKSSAAASKAEERSEKLKEHSHNVEKHSEVKTERVYEPEPESSPAPANKSFEAKHRKIGPEESEHSSSSQKSPGKSGQGWIKRNASKLLAVLKNDINPSKRWLFELLFLAVIIVQVVDFLNWGFSSTDTIILYKRAFAYFIISFFASWAFSSSIAEFLLGIFDFFLIVSLVPVFIIPILSWAFKLLGASANASNILGAIIGFVPWWLLYLIFVRNVSFPSPAKAGKKIFHYLSPSVLSRLYIIGLSLVFVIWLFTTLIMPNMTNTVAQLTQGENTAVNPQTAIPIFQTFVKTTVNNVVKGITGIGSGVKNAYVGWQNATMGQEYSSQVEQNKALTGIFITSLSFTQSPSEDTDTILVGTVKARSFGNVTKITPQCYAQRTDGTNKTTIQANSVDPPSIDMYMEDQLNVMCDFGQNLTNGSYKFVMELDFNFQTAAYVVYPFIDENLSRQLVHDGFNANTYFNVPEKTKTIYTAGPVKVAMSDEVAMPFTLSINRNNKMPFGLSVENYPQSTGNVGEITSMKSVSIKVPRAFDVPNTASCKYTSKLPMENPFYYEYVFLFSAGAVSKDSKVIIACNANISPNAVYSIISDPAGINAITLQGIADYNYNLSRSLSGTVTPSRIPK